MSQSCASDTRSPEGDSSRIFSIASLRVAELRQITQHQIVALLVLQHLSQRVAADGRLHGVLHVRDVDLIARGLLAVDRKIQVGLPDHAKHAQILNSRDAAASRP